MTIRDMTAADLESVLAINELNTADVGPLSLVELTTIHSDAALALVAVGPEGDVVGFALVVDAGCRHLSPRAEWALDAAGPDLHMERVAFDMRYSGYGLGLALYEELDVRLARLAASAPGGELRLSSMVRLEPPNEHSIRFHASRGFETTDRAEFDDTVIGVAVRTYRG